MSTNLALCRQASMTALRGQKLGRAVVGDAASALVRVK